MLKLCYKDDIHDIIRIKVAKCILIICETSLDLKEYDILIPLIEKQCFNDIKLEVRYYTSIIYGEILYVNLLKDHQRILQLKKIQLLLNLILLYIKK